MTSTVATMHSKLRFSYQINAQILVFKKLEINWSIFSFLEYFDSLFSTHSLMFGSMFNLPRFLDKFLSYDYNFFRGDENLKKRSLAPSSSVRIFIMLNWNNCTCYLSNKRFSVRFKVFRAFHWLQLVSSCPLPCWLPLIWIFECFF